MKHLLLVVFWVAFGLVAQAKDRVEPFAGSYYRGDHLGYNVTLVLQEDGRYQAWWDGCLGRYGTAKGTWKLSDNKLVLSPLEEVDMMKGHLRVLNIRKYDGRFELLPEEDDKRMKSEEEKRMFSFTKADEEKEANQTPEPTRSARGSS